MKLNRVIFLSVALVGVSGYSQTSDQPPQQPVNPYSAQNPNSPQQGQGSPAQNSQLVGTNGGPNPVDENTNQSVWNTNQFGTNQLGLATNQFGKNAVLSPTSQAGFTNRILPTNSAGIMTNANSPLMRDQALSETDQRLLAQIRGAVFGPNQGGASPAGSTVHFILMDGAVRLVGTVPTMEERAD
jgi:hypothetical protein